MVKLRWYCTIVFCKCWTVPLCAMVQREMMTTCLIIVLVIQ